MLWAGIQGEWEKYFATKGHQMVSKLRSAAARPEPEPDATDDLAVLDLAASALFDDPELIGPALVLLTARSCSAACGPVGRRPRSIRDRGYGPID
jgi:hypothetical protein